MSVYPYAEFKQLPVDQQEEAYTRQLDKINKQSHDLKTGVCKTALISIFVACLLAVTIALLVHYLPQANYYVIGCGTAVAVLSMSIFTWLKCRAVKS